MADTKNAAVTGETRIVTQVPLIAPLQRRKRVAAYARVSSDKDAMLHSLAAQVEYYNEYIQQHPGWEFAGIYADEGLSGTKVNRPEFQRLLCDCRAGKIDLILVKSVSRFARNTLTMLTTVRELKSLGIDVYFEKENLRSMSGDGELMLSILASFAQAESQSVSENCRWRIQKNFREGIPIGTVLYGYRMKKGTFKIIPEEAAVIRRIFDMYLCGIGRESIVAILNKEGVPAPMGGKWHPCVLFKILRNEKYAGDLLMQKYFFEDYLTKKRRINRGELPQYYVQDDHEPIIDRGTFERVQQLIQIRAEKYGGVQRDDKGLTYLKRADGEYLFRGKIICGVCGKTFCRKTGNAGTKYAKPVWICSTFFYHGKVACPSKRIAEKMLVSITSDMLGVGAEELPEAIGRVSQMTIFPDGRLDVCLDGERYATEWSKVSRSAAWDEEHRRAASTRAKESWKRRKEK